jgi:cytochrome c biogenesis protein CcmG, thiol:disulfide interchange protein DsbE
MKFFIPIAVFMALLVVFMVGLNRDPSYVPSPLIGKPAPEFRLPRLSDPEQTLGTEDMRGQFSLLNVWATWCVGCRQEHDTLLQIASDYGVPIYGLNWKDNTVQARTWLEQLGNPYAATAVDFDGAVAIDWGVYGAPETFLLAADGTVLYKHLSPLTMAIWEAEFLPRMRSGTVQEP